MSAPKRIARRQPSTACERDAHAVGAVDGRTGERGDEAESGVDHRVVGFGADPSEISGDIGGLGDDRYGMVVGALLSAECGDGRKRRFELDERTDASDVEDPAGMSRCRTHREHPVRRCQACRDVGDDTEPSRIDERERGQVEDEARVGLVDERAQDGAERRRRQRVDVVPSAHVSWSVRRRGS
jgi:hypothetical protein